MVQPLDRVSEVDTDAKPKLREVSYEHSNNLAEILQHLRISLFFSTYQAGKLGVVTAKDNKLDIAFHNFERAMGMAVSNTRMAVGGKDWVYFLKKRSRYRYQN